MFRWHPIIPVCATLASFSNIPIQTLSAHIIVILVWNQTVVAGNFILMLKCGVPQLASRRKVILIFDHRARTALTIGRCSNFCISIETRCTCVASFQIEHKQIIQQPLIGKKNFDLPFASRVVCTFAAFLCCKIASFSMAIAWAWQTDAELFRCRYIFIGSYKAKIARFTWQPRIALRTDALFHQIGTQFIFVLLAVLQRSTNQYAFGLVGVKWSTQHHTFNITQNR